MRQRDLIQGYTVQRILLRSLPDEPEAGAMISGNLVRWLVVGIVYSLLAVLVWR